MLQRVGKFLNSNCTPQQNMGCRKVCKTHHSHFLLHIEDETLCFLSCGRFPSKTAIIPRNERNCTTCRECLETFNGQAAGLLWITPQCAYFDIDQYPKNDPCKDIQGRFPLLLWKNKHRLPAKQTHPRGRPFPVSPDLPGEGCDAWQSEESLHFFDWKCWSGSCPEPNDRSERMRERIRMEKDGKLQHHKNCKIEAWNRDEHEWRWYANENLVIQVYSWWFWLISCI